MAMVITKRKAWMQAFRLHTLPLAFASIFMGNIIAYSEGKFNFLIGILTLLVAACLQILSNLANDYGDAKHGADTEERVGPKRAIQTGLISIQEIKTSIFVFVLLSFVSGIFLLLLSIGNIGYWAALILFLLGLLSIAAAIAYTATDRPYGYQGLGDISVFIFFGMIGVFGAFFLQAGSFSPAVLLPAAGMGLLSTGVLNVNNIRDIETDLDAGKKTLAVRLGLNYSKIYHWCLLLGSIGCFLVYSFYKYKESFQFLFHIPALLFFVNGYGVWKSKHSSEVIPYLKELIIAILIYSLSFGISLVI